MHLHLRSEYLRMQVPDVMTPTYNYFRRAPNVGPKVFGASYCHIPAAAKGKIERELGNRIV